MTLLKLPPTGGPWYVKHDGLYIPEIFSEQFVDHQGSPLVVARAYSWREVGAQSGSNHRALRARRVAEAWTNARLIAAAPDLLAALERLANIADEGAVMRHETGKPTWSFIDEVKQSARAAIAKAKGEVAE